MMLREAIERYILWRQAHGARFSTEANLLRRFLEYADGDAACDAAPTARVLAFLAGKASVGDGVMMFARANGVIVARGSLDEALDRQAAACVNGNVPWPQAFRLWNGLTRPVAPVR